MIFATLDEIICRTLLEKGLPIQYYMEFLYHGASCMRQLARSSTCVVNYANLPVNSYGAVDIPSDCAKVIACCIQVGQEIAKLPVKESINPLRKVDSVTSAFVPYQNVTTDSAAIYGFPAIAGYFYNVDAYGGYEGGVQSVNGGLSTGYKIIKERRQIQFTEDMINQGVVVVYLTDGQSIDNASQIDMAAFDVIQKYIIWKISPNANADRSPEGGAYYNQKRLLRINISDLDVTQMREILANSYGRAIKN